MSNNNNVETDHTKDPLFDFDITHYTLPPPQDIGIPVVIDNGTGTIKAGFAGEDAPRLIVPSVVGKPRQSEECSKEQSYARYVGEEALLREAQVDLSWPVEHGLISDWEDMEKLWHHVFYDALLAPPECHPIMLSEPPHNTKQLREQTAETLFETFNCPAMYMANQAVLAMYSTGKTTGIVLDCGKGMTNVVPVFEGFSVDHAMLRQDFGGKEMTDYLETLLMKKGHKFETTNDREEVVKIKETLCYISPPTGLDKKTPEDGESEKIYELPDGTKIDLSEELFQCPEVLFKPGLLTGEEAQEHRGVINMLNSSVTKCEPGYHKPLFRNIVLVGGGSMFPGLPERLYHQMEAVAPEGMKVKVVAAPERHLAVWIGGSILASLPNFQTMWIKKKDYCEVGPSVIHRKCF